MDLNKNPVISMDFLILKINFPAFINEIIAYARMKSAMQMKSKPMAWMKLNPPIRCRAGFHPRRGFHRRRRFVPPARVDLVEKSTAFAVLFSGFQPVH